MNLEKVYNAVLNKSGTLPLNLSVIKVEKLCLRPPEEFSYHFIDSDAVLRVEYNSNVAQLSSGDSIFKNERVSMQEKSVLEQENVADTHDGPSFHNC
ncbi:hypothetical protein TNCV_2030861 [Trichonephila clavipes]|nr:hypothetical protein TNCV_2030861 [Trichonephila clavipes]